jgi:hypothetical protein
MRNQHLSAAPAYDTSDALGVLRYQHREIDRLLDALARTPFAASRGLIVAELGDALAVHMALEERVFYPGLFEPANDVPGGAVVVAVEDHAALKRELATLLQAEPTSADFEEALRRLRARAAAHVDAEERLFPRLRRRVSRTRLRRLAYEMSVLEFQLRTDAPPRRLVADEAAAAVTA